MSSLPPPQEPKIPTLIQYTPQDVERLADILALITVAFGIMQAGSWAGKDNWIVAIAIGAAIAYLVINYNGPLRVFLRQIFMEVLDAIFQAVNLIYAWLYLAYTYYGGRILRLLLDIVLWMLAGWAFERLQNYPAIRDFWASITNFVQTTFNLAKQAVDTVYGALLNFQTWVRDQIGHLAAQILTLGDQITMNLDTLRDFVLSHIEASVDALRLDLLSFFNSGMNRILGELAATRLALESAIKDTQAWVLQQIGNVYITIGDLRVSLPLVSLYSAWRASQEARYVPGVAVAVMLTDLRDFTAEETDRPMGIADWILADTRAALQGVHPIPEVNTFARSVSELIDLWLPAPPPPPPAA